MYIYINYESSYIAFQEVIVIVLFGFIPIQGWVSAQVPMKVAFKWQKKHSPNKKKQSETNSTIMVLKQGNLLENKICLSGQFIIKKPGDSMRDVLHPQKRWDVTNRGHEEIGLILGEGNLTQIYPMTDPWDVSYIYLHWSHKT